MPGYKRNLFLLAVIVGYVIPCFNVNAAPKWRTAYYANEDSNTASLSYLPLSEIPWQKYTHLIQANIVPTAVNGVPGIDTSSYNIGNGPGSKAQEFVALAQQNHVKALVAVIVGNGQQARDMESNTNSTNINNFISVLKAFVNDNKYDGIDIDWEGYAVIADFMVQFPDFICRLRDAMPSKVITIAGGVEYRNLYLTRCKDGMHVYEKVDQINLMTYDQDGTVYSGQASPKTWFNTSVRRNAAWPFDSPSNNYGNNRTLEENLKYVLEYAKIPAAKIGLGVPFYGYLIQAPFSSTDGVTLPEQLYASSGLTPNNRIPISYRQLVTPIVASDGVTLQSRTMVNTPRAWVPYYWNYGIRTWNDIYKAPYISYNVIDPAEDAFVTYTDPQQLSEFIKLLNEKGLGGMMTFALGHEYLPNKTGDDRYPLSTAVFNGMLALSNADAIGVNVAYGKQATQSSTFNNATASLAVDGNADGNYWNGSVTHTDTAGTNAWWEVDLQGIFNINHIKVWNRTDCCSNRLQPFTASILSEDRSVVWSNTQDSYPSPSMVLNAEGKYGRYVRISGPNILSLAEVQVYSSLKNIARGKLATQSSTFNNATASLAVDGNTDGDYWNGSVTHTATGGTNAWWKVDLRGTFNIGQIKISNRTDCCKDRLSKFSVDILDLNGNVVWSNFQTTFPDSNITIMPGGIMGAYVKIYGPDILSLAEVQVIEY